MTRHEFFDLEDLILSTAHRAECSQKITQTGRQSLRKAQERLKWTTEACARARALAEMSKDVLS